MADVNRGRGRAQMLLVSAFGLAVMLVALALILNTAIFTENVATRGSDNVGGKDALQYRQAVESGTGGIIQRANYNNASGGYSELESELKAGIENWSDLAGQGEALNGRATSAEFLLYIKGTRLHQDTDRNFTNASGTKNWTLVDDTPDVRNFTMNVTESGLADGSVGSLSETFRVEVSNVSDTWEIHVYDDTVDANRVNVTVIDHTGAESTCSATPGTRVTVDVTAATLDGEDCPALEIFDDVTIFDVSYNETLNSTDDPTITGRYNLVVRKEHGNVDSTDFGSNPEMTRAIYSARVKAIHESNRLLYVTEIRVAPGEPDE